MPQYVASYLGLFCLSYIQQYFKMHQEVVEWTIYACGAFISAKNSCELDIVLTRAVNILTTNELVKLTTL